MAIDMLFETMPAFDGNSHPADQRIMFLLVGMWRMRDLSNANKSVERVVFSLFSRDERIICRLMTRFDERIIFHLLTVREKAAIKQLNLVDI